VRLLIHVGTQTFESKTCGELDILGVDTHYEMLKTAVRLDGTTKTLG